MVGLAVLAAASFVLPELLPYVLAVDGLFLALVVADLLRTPSPRHARVRRSLPERVGLSRELARDLELELSGAGGLGFEVHEEFPPAFVVPAAEPADPTGGPDRGAFDDRGRARARRAYRCDLRGRHRFGDLRLVVTSPLGLSQRSARFRGMQLVDVEPALQDLSRTLQLAASERWRDLGVRLLRRHGGASEFESLREYVHGDDKKRVDWKAFARRGKPMVRQYQVERGQELFLLIDGGRRMRAVAVEGRLRGWTKLDWALDAALQLAAVALSKGDRVGAAVFARGLEAYVAPAKGARQLARLSRALFDRQPVEYEADLGAALRELLARHRRRATVVVLSDVADPLSVDVQRRALQARSRRHRVVFAALDDPDVRAVAEGRLDEGPAVRAGALELIQDRRRALKQLAASGVRVLDALPAEAAAPLLAAWLEERRVG